MLDRAVETDGRGERQPQREGQHDHDMRQHQADEGAAEPELGEEAQEGDAQHDMRDHRAAT